MNKTKIVLLIGGIASGKSFVTHHLASMGAHIIDTDVLAKQLTDPSYSEYSRQALCEIQKAFGAKIVNSALILDRKLLRNLIFSDPSAKEMLENILHPKILLLVHKALNKPPLPYTILVVPVINQSSSYFALADCVLAIEAPPNIQLQRLMERDNISSQLAQKMIDAQITNSERRRLADTIIINKHGNHTKRTLTRLHSRYCH